MEKIKDCTIKIATFTLAVLFCAGPAFAVTSTVTETVTPTVTETVTPTVTETITPTVTETITPTVTETITPTVTETTTGTVTETVSETFTPTQTQQQSETFTPTFTVTPTITETSTITTTVTMTLTPIPTATVIDSYYDSLALTIYPNPVKSGDNIYMLYNFTGQTTMTLEIYSLDGTRAMNENYSVSGRGRVTASTAGLAPGVYYYIVQSGSGRTGVKKLVVSR